LGAALTVGDPSLAVAGGTAAVTGGLLGSLVGAMVSRGQEQELANYVDQSTMMGDIIVAVELHGDDAEARLEQAAQVLQQAGARPVPLVEG
jgi:predicted ABC-type sugar transport system permease subunit